jgi:hypothetical protein
MNKLLKIATSIISVIVFWLLAIGWTYLRDGEGFTFEGVESTLLSFLVGVVVFDIVDRIWD